MPNNAGAVIGRHLSMPQVSPASPDFFDFNLSSLFLSDFHSHNPFFWTIYTLFSIILYF